MGHRLGVDLSPKRLNVRFPPGANLSTKLGELVAAESQCCGFVDWQLDEQSDGLVLTIFWRPGRGLGDGRQLRGLALSLTVRSLSLLWALLFVVAWPAPVATDLEVVDLSGVDQLADDFNQAGSDSPRLLLLLSPT